MVGPKVHGGILSSQALQGNLRFFKLSSAALGYFAHTVGASTFIPGSGEPIITNGKPVPGSVADHIFRTIAEKCTILQVSIIDANDIDFVCQGSGFGWDTPAVGDAASEMLVAIKALGTIGAGAIGSLDSPIPDGTATGVPSRDLNVAGVTLVEVRFNLV